jgi:hypothetical protein
MLPARQDGAAPPAGTAAHLAAPPNRFLALDPIATDRSTAAAATAAAGSAGDRLLGAAGIAAAVAVPPAATAAAAAPALAEADVTGAAAALGTSQTVRRRAWVVLLPWRFARLQTVRAKLEPIIPAHLWHGSLAFRERGVILTSEMLEDYPDMNDAVKAYIAPFWVPPPDPVIPTEIRHCHAAPASDRQTPSSRQAAPRPPCATVCAQTPLRPSALTVYAVDLAPSTSTQPAMPPPSPRPLSAAASKLIIT